MMDVAQAASVSQATVSLVLSGSKGARLADATRGRVLEAAKALGYKFVRRGPRSGQGAATILFIADETTTDPWMSLAFQGARDQALQHDVNVLMAVSHGDPEVEAAILAGLGSLPLLGVIYGTILTREVQLPVAITERRVALVNCYDKTRALHSILPGDVLGGRTATEHLLKIGRKRVGFINGQEGLDNPRDRLKGYKQALLNHDIPFDPALVRHGNWEPSSGYAITRELMALDNPPDGIFCANDMMAVGCYDALKELGLTIPEDVAVIGFDDRDIARDLHPPLTTLILPLYEMGQTAAELLLTSGSGSDGYAQRIKVGCELVVRASTIRPGIVERSKARA